MFTGDMGGVRMREILSTKLSMSPFSKSYRRAFEEYVPPHSPTRNGVICPRFTEGTRGDQRAVELLQMTTQTQSLCEVTTCRGLPLMGILGLDSP